MFSRDTYISVVPSAQTPAEVRAEFLSLTEGGSRIRCAGAAARKPSRLLDLGYVPSHKIELFNVTFYLSDVRKNEDVRFIVAYVALRETARGNPRVYSRMFYKDGSLLWRSASHFTKTKYENWIGKGDLKIVSEADGDFFYSAEHTTDLPLEMQAAIETINASKRGVPLDERAIALVVRRSSPTRLIAYKDFTEPRRKAARRRSQLVNGGRPIARFTRSNDPASLAFVSGYEPDFSRTGRIDVTSSHSRLYEGRVHRHRFFSRNRRMQYLFFSAPKRVWLGYPQALTTELSRFGVRTIDVSVPDDLVVPGMEYHYLESEDPPVWMSQIPPGYAGAISPHDPWRADASPWLNELPVVKEFRRKVLRHGVESGTMRVNGAMVR
jgi:hypothetical protein